jgi:hypothetical protein
MERETTLRTDLSGYYWILQIGTNRMRVLDEAQPLIEPLDPSLHKTIYSIKYNHMVAAVPYAKHFVVR